MEQLRWNGHPVCPYCNEQKPYKLKDGKTYRCRSKTCRKDFTVTIGTIFDNTKLPLSTWFASLYMVTHHEQGISSLRLSRDLGVTQKTAWFVLHRIRHIVSEED
ncbi:MAG: transposase [Chitinophagaceae bacterium]|nr:transposase [Chitinophagaceae bacterium]